MTWQYIICCLIAMMWSVARGWEQAVLWGRLGAESYKWNEHIIFLVVRGLFIGLLLVTGDLTIWSKLFIAGGFIFTFPFFHEGMYYEQRYQIGRIHGSLVYPKRWWSDPSGTSTANTKFTYKTRIWLAIAGLAIFITGLILI